MDNYSSATHGKFKRLAEEQIIEEIEHGHYVLTKDTPLITSALGAIPKGSSKNAIRLVHDASRPQGNAANDFSHTDPFCYQTL